MADMSVAQKQKLEAVKLLSDWSKWLVTVETGGVVAVLGLIITLAKSQLNQVLTFVLLGLLTVTAVAFAVSVCYASFLLISLPNVAEHLHRTEDGTSIFYMSDKDVGWTIVRLTNGQLRWFLVGLVFTLFSILCAGIGVLAGA